MTWQHQVWGAGNLDKKQSIISIAEAQFRT
jgi:hypothetical protein